MRRPRFKFGDKFLEDPSKGSPIEHWSHEFAKEVEGPPGILSSPELYLAIKENRELIQEMKQEIIEEIKEELRYELMNALDV